MTEIIYQDELVTLFHGEFQSWVKTEPVDLVIADPPYPKEFKHLYDDLLAFSANSLWLGGSLVTIAPHYLLPYIFHIDNPKMRYRWMICMYQQQGAHPRMAMGIEVCWKPVLWYVRGAYRGGRGYVTDLFVNLPPPPPSKKLHKWQQSESWAEWLISKFSDKDELVFDPMAGSGTALVVARRLGRRAIGFEREQEAAMVAVKRLESNA
jgi:DNA modification methylase